MQRRLLAEALIALLAELLDPLVRDAGVPKELSNFPGGYLQRLRYLGLLVALNQLPQPLVDRLDHIHAAVLLQRLLKGPAKGLPLLYGGHRQLRAEHRFHKLRVADLWLAEVVQGVVEIGGAVVEGREEEAQLRLAHNLLGHAAVKLVFPGEEAQGRFPVLHRADGADQVGEDLIGGVRLQVVVLAAVGHVVGVVGQEDKVVAVVHVQGLDYPLEEGLPGGSILEGRLPQGHQEPVLLAVRHLLGGEYDIHQVFPQGAGNGLFQEPQILLGLLLGHKAHRLVQIGDDLPVRIDIAAVDPADSVLVWPETAAQLADFLLDHGIPLSYVFA